MVASRLRIRTKCKGAALLLFTGALMFAIVGFFATAFLSQYTSSQDRGAASATSMQSAKSKVLDFVHQNATLPSVAQFQAMTAGLTDYWGRPFLYFPSSSMVGATVTGVASTPITIMQCTNDPNCATYTRIDNIPFLIVSAGEVVYSASSAINQTTLLNASAEIITQTFFKVYDPGFQVGPFDDSNNSSLKRVYDDQILMSNMPEVYAASTGLSTTKGDVVDSGGDLKILNTSPLPQGTCQVAYSKVLTAYGKDTGAFTWNITGLPTGLTAAASTSKSITVSGTPTAKGTFTVSTSISDPNARQSSKSLSLTIVSPGWTDTGSTQTLSCASGYTGSIAQKQQSDSCGGTQWVDTSNTCTFVNTATSNRQLSYANINAGIAAAGGSTTTINSGVPSFSVGTGTDGFTVTGSANITRSSAGTGSTAIGVAGGASDYINAGESITFDFTGGFARTLGFEFRGFGVRTFGGTDRTEDAIITMINTVTSATVGTVTLRACVSEAGTGTTQRSTFFVPDPGAIFNRIIVTANNSPASTDFEIRAIRACGVGSACLPTGATGTACP